MPCLVCRDQIERHHTREEGQASLEFIMVIPVFLMVTLALCQVVLALCCYLGVHHASREGARRGVETNDGAMAERHAISAASWLPCADENLDVTVGFPEGRERGDPVEVRVEYRMPVLFPLLERIVPDDVTIKHATTMYLERPREG